MAQRGVVRLGSLALLVGLAMVGMAERAPAPETARIAPGGSWLAVWLVVALAVPVLVIMVIAAARFRPRRVRQAVPGPAGHPWLGALVFLALLGIAGVVSAFPPRAEHVAWVLTGGLVLGAGVVLLARVPSRTPAAATEPEPLAVAMSRGLVTLTDMSTDPRTAIIRCFAVMEEALAEVPAAVPLPADSPSEVLERATAAGVVRAAGAWRLVELFDEARFSQHSMGEADRAEAEASLRVILDELRGQP